MTDHYRWSGGCEQLFRLGDPTAPQILFLQPFFEEANRLRRLIACVMRDVASAGFGVVLPDLPGAGESLVQLETVTLEDWRSGAAAAVESIGGAFMTVSFRSAALIDHASQAQHVWRCAPETGQRVVRDLMRTQLTSTNDQPEEGDIITLAGNRVNRALIDALSSAVPAHHPSLRVAQLATSSAKADIKLEGSPLWRRAEPGEDKSLQNAISNDIIAWAKQCAAR